MGGLSFIHVGFLAAGTAVAVPIVIHLLFRQRARRVDVGSLHFLKVVLRDHARRRKVRRWLLLAMRAAAVVLLALLFARPYRKAPEITGPEREVVILIDRSASMGAGGPKRSPFAEAQRRASAILDKLPDGTKVHLAHGDAAGVIRSEKVTIDPKARPGFAGTDHAKMLAWARDLLGTSKRTHRHVYLLTDLQRSGLDQGSAGVDLPRGVTVEVVDVGRPLLANLAIDEATATRPDVRPGEPATITARVHNAGPFAAKRVRVRLRLDGADSVEQEQTVSLDGGERRVVRFAVPLNRAGVYQGTAEVVGDDDLDFDDRRWLAFEARAPDRILLVDGDPGGSVFGHETYYLEAALRLKLPDDRRAPVTPYEPTRLAWGEGATLPDLAPFRVVVLCNVADVPDEVAARLDAYLASGGRLILFGGDRVQAGAYAALRRAGALPANCEGPSEAGVHRFATWEREHPWLRPFADAQHGDLRTLGFRRITRWSPSADARVLASTTAGRPLLIEAVRGPGRVIVAAMPADNEWGEWAIRRLYLPLIHQMMGHATGRLPEHSVARAMPVGAGVPGIERDDEKLVVRNVDPAESDVARAPIAEFRAALGLTDADVKTPEIEPPRTPGGERPEEVWRWVAWGLLIVLTAETFLANRTYA